MTVGVPETDAAGSIEAAEAAGTRGSDSRGADGPEAERAAPVAPDTSVASVAPADSAASADTAGSAAAGRPWIKRLRKAATGRPARFTFLAVAFGLGAWAIADDWTQVQNGLTTLGPAALGGALVLTIAAWSVMMIAWRGLLADAGSPLPVRASSRIFFLGQLGKYVPGSVWPVVAQMELGRAHKVPRVRSATAAILATLVSLVAALLTAAATLPFASGAATDDYLWAFAAVPVLVVGLHPRVANPVLKRLFRLAKRPPLERDLTGRTIATATARGVVAWTIAGLHVWLLAVRLGAPPGQTFLFATGGFAFAWSVGFIFVLAPAGAGVRELILIAALTPVLDPGKATAVAVASRLVTIVADLVAAGIAASLTGGRPRRTIED